MQIIITVSKALKKPMSHARRFRFLLIIYLPISLQLRLATRPMTCAHCLSHETHGRGPLTVGDSGSLNLLNPLLLRHWLLVMYVYINHC